MVSGMEKKTETAILEKLREKEKERNLQMIWKLGVDDCDFLRGNSEYFRTIHSLKKP